MRDVCIYIYLRGFNGNISILSLSHIYIYICTCLRVLPSISVGERARPCTWRNLSIPALLFFGYTWAHAREGGQSLMNLGFSAHARGDLLAIFSRPNGTARDIYIYILRLASEFARAGFVF